MSSRTSSRHVSAVVIGGGPAGSTAAALLARAGIDVLLLEREKFPRYHIGESLLPSCPLVLELSGALSKVDAAGFIDKRGGLFRWGTQDWVINWLDIYGSDHRSWLVDRGVFDKILLDNARDQGVRIRELAVVQDVGFDGDRARSVRWREAGRSQVEEVTCDWVIDASGRAGVLAAQKFSSREYHKVFRNVAIWAYWKGGRTLPGTPPGGLNSISAPGGWYWIIPMADGRLSAGFVTHRDTFRSQRKNYSSLEDMVKAVMYESDDVRPLLEGHEFIPPARAEQDYSYAASAFCGPGWMLCGDSAAFLDPLLSTGVHLALYSATVAAASIIAMRDGTAAEAEALAFYEYCYRRAYARLLTLVSKMYEQYRGKQTYFWTAHQLNHQSPVLDQQTVGDRDFADLSAGLTDLTEAGGGITDGTRRILTAQLVDQARRVQEKAIALGAEDSVQPPLDIAPVHWQPNTSQEPAAGFTLVTSPRLGLVRLPRNATS
jgi:flavin-dependent dehydrogenase